MVFNRTKDYFYEFWVSRRKIKIPGAWIDFFTFQIFAQFGLLFENIIVYCLGHLLVAISWSDWKIGWIVQWFSLCFPSCLCYWIQWRTSLILTSIIVCGSKQVNSFWKSLHLSAIGKSQPPLFCWQCCCRNLLSHSCTYILEMNPRNIRT